MALRPALEFVSFLACSLHPDFTTVFTSLTMDYSQSDSGVSKRLSWGRMVQRLLKHADDTKPTGKRDSGCLSVFSMDDDPFEEAVCAETVAHVSDVLSEGSAELLGSSRLVVPHVLLERIGQELLQLAATEPCGLRGAIIDVCVDNSKSPHSVGQISVDPEIVPTFHLTFLLRLDLGGLWPKFTSRICNSVKLSTGFTVLKRKLYSSEEVYVEELGPEDGTSFKSWGQTLLENS